MPPWLSALGPPCLTASRIWRAVVGAPRSRVLCTADMSMSTHRQRRAGHHTQRRSEAPTRHNRAGRAPHPVIGKGPCISVRSRCASRSCWRGPQGGLAGGHVLGDQLARALRGQNAFGHRPGPPWAPGAHFASSHSRSDPSLIRASHSRAKSASVLLRTRM